MSHNLNSLQGVMSGIMEWSIVGVLEGILGV